MAGEGYTVDDTKEEAWDKYMAANPDVLVSYRQQSNRWPMGHPNEMELDEEPTW